MEQRYRNDALISGFLDKVGKLRSKRRGYYELIGSILYKSKRKNERGQEVDWELDICDGTVASHGRNGLSISLPNGMNIVFYAKNEISWLQWYRAFEIAVRQKLENFYELKEQIGEGGFATVFRGICRRTGHNMAVKRIDKGSSDAKFLSREGKRRTFLIYLWRKGKLDDSKMLTIFSMLLISGCLYVRSGDSQGLHIEIRRCHA